MAAREAEADDRTDRAVRIGNAAGAVVLGLVVAYGALSIAHLGWVGDVNVYVAALREIWTHPLSPRHESLDLPATSSVAFTPYLYAVAAIARPFTVDGYRALQGAGIVNLVSFVAGLVFLLKSPTWQRSAASTRAPLLAAACVASVMLFLRSETFFISSETSYDTLPYILAYPSTCAWALSFFAFGLVERALGVHAGALGVHAEALVDPRPRTVVTIALLVAFVLASHPLTGSWLFGICGLRAGLAGVRDRAHRRRALVLVAALVAGAVGATLWPYAAFLHANVVFAKEAAGMRDRPLAPFAWLYGLAAVAVVRAAVVDDVQRKRAAWLAGGAVVTLVVYGIARALHVEYAARYILFAAFFAQILVGTQLAADLLGLGALRALRDPAAFRRGLVAGAGVVAVAIALATSPILLHPRKHGALPPLAALVSARSAKDRYEEQFSAFRGFLKPSDVVLISDEDHALRLAALFGSHAVDAVYCDHIADKKDRHDDTTWFFKPKTWQTKHLGILDRWNVTVVVVDNNPEIEALMTKAYGPPVVRDHARVLFRLPPPEKEVAP